MHENATFRHSQKREAGVLSLELVVILVFAGSESASPRSPDEYRATYSTTPSSEADLANKFRHHQPREGFYRRSRLSSRPATLILTFPLECTEKEVTFNMFFRSDIAFQVPAVLSTDLHLMTFTPEDSPGVRTTVIIHKIAVYPRRLLLV